MMVSPASDTARAVTARPSFGKIGFVVAAGLIEAAWLSTLAWLVAAHL